MPLDKPHVQPTDLWRIEQRGAVASEPSTPRPLLSENVFDVLLQRVVVTPMQISKTTGNFCVTVPQILETPDPPFHLPTDAYVGGTKIHRAQAVRVEMPLEAILDEFAILDRDAKEMQQSFDKICETPRHTQSWNYSSISPMVKWTGSSLTGKQSNRIRPPTARARSLAAGTPHPHAQPMDASNMGSSYTIFNSE
ncbi:unnamed protein product [Aphanomyces euteiches]|nr:hypothetical protein Ae201684P_015903 [Aphanomyces euteiches]